MYHGVLRYAHIARYYRRQQQKRRYQYLALFIMNKTRITDEENKQERKGREPREGKPLPELPRGGISQVIHYICNAPNAGKKAKNGQGPEATVLKGGGQNEYAEIKIGHGTNTGQNCQ